MAFPPELAKLPEVADIFSKRKRSEVMSRIRARGNKDTELVLANLLRTHGMTGWRRHLPLFGRPDFTFSKQRLVIFVDGCFWHGCRWHCRMPTSNLEFWETKLARNRARDRLVRLTLRRQGWRVLRFWEHELRRPERVLMRINAAFGGSTVTLPPKKKSIRMWPGQQGTAPLVQIS